MGEHSPATDVPPAPPPIPSPYLTAKEAAAYLNVAYGTFRHIATRIRRCRHGRYHRDDLDAYARSPGRSRPRPC